VPLGTSEEQRAVLIKDKYVTLQALDATPSLKLEAKRLKCDYYMDDNNIKKV
jgi:hypothetical protein